MVYCESCMEEDLDYWEELYDGTIICSKKCEKDWKEIIEINRKESD